MKKIVTPLFSFLAAPVNEMEELRCESDRGGDEVYPVTFGGEEKNGLKLDDDELVGY